MNSVGLGTVAHFVSFTSCKHNFLVLVCAAKCLVLRLEIHARTTIGSPEVNDDASMFLRQIQKMGLRLNLANFTKFGFGEGLRLAACTAELAHHLLELGGIHPESLGNRIQHSRIVLKGTHCLLHHLRAHSRYVGHTLRCLGLGRLLLLLSLLLLLLSVQCEVLVLIFLKNRVRSLHQVVLHAGQHRCELLSHRGVHEGLRQVNNFLWDSGS